MSRAGVKLAVDQIARDLFALASAVLEDDTVSTNTKIGRNTLRDSALRGDLSTVVQSTNDPVISALFNHYVVYLEWSRPPRYKNARPSVR